MNRASLPHWAQIVFLLFFLQCQQANRSLQLEYAYLQPEAKVNPHLNGIWKSIGGGYLWDATEDSIRLYSYTETYCFKENNDYLEGLMNSEAQFRLEQDTLQVFLTDYGPATSKLNTPWLFIQVDAIPETCMDRKALEAATPEVTWELFLENLQENYAFSRERGLDWDRINHAYSPKVNESTPDDSLFKWMGEIVLQTQDHHTKIFNKAGRRIQYTRVPSADTVYGSFLNQDEIQDLNEYYGKFFASSYGNITDSLLHGAGIKSANGQLEWGMLDEKTGYLHIHSFAGFVKTPQPRKLQIDSLKLAMTEAIQALQKTESIIVDVSFNFGGFDAAALTVASFFTNRKVLAYTAQVFFEGDYVNSGPVYVFPSSSTPYTKPIYLLTSDISRSAAEGFTMMMKALPQVTHVGTPTLGILSGMLNKSLGDFHSTCSYQRLLNTDGQYYEATGVPPDVPLEMFNRPNVMRAHLETVREVMALMDK